MKSKNPHHDADRETLSALFDGELQGDAARFAMRRLGHDDTWREACGRWQLLGDVLRGQGSAQAPAGFAMRVETALAGERAEVVRATGTAGHVPAVRRWTRSRMGGAALAASVAFVALMVVRPGFDDTAPAGAGEALTAAPVTSADGTAPAAPAAEPSSRVASVPQASPPVTESDPAPVQPGSELGLAAAVAAAELPRRARSQNTRSQVQHAGGREIQVPAPAAGASADEGMIASLPPTAAPGDLHPFLPPADQIPTRPWPSATLPDYPAPALTASYGLGEGAAGGRSGAFYPFEPRLSKPQAQALLEALRLQAPPSSREGPRR